MRSIGTSKTTTDGSSDADIGMITILIFSTYIVYHNRHCDEACGHLVIRTTHKLKLGLKCEILIL